MAEDVTSASPSRRKQATKAEEITIEYYEGDLCLVREKEKKILSKGGWSTIMFLYEEYDRRSGAYREPKISIRRYQKREGVYIPRSKFTISSASQAKTVADKLNEWTEALEAKK